MRIGATNEEGIGRQRRDVLYLRCREA